MKSFISYSAFYAPANLVCVCLGLLGWSALPVSHLYGFGLLDAESMVKEAERWKQVPLQRECVEEASIQPSRYHTNNTAKDLCFYSGLPLIPPLSSHLLLLLFQFSPGFLSRLFSHTLMGVVFFTAPILVGNSLVFCLLSPPPAVSLHLPLHHFLFLFLSHDRAIHPGLPLTSTYETTGCSANPQQQVAYVEHVVVRVTITHSRRGDLSIALTSPSGTVSQLLANR